MPRAYMPLKTIAHPPLIQFTNGVALVSHDAFKPSNLDGWQQVFSLDELREIREWHLAIACNWNTVQEAQQEAAPEYRLADARLALQVAAPMGSYLSVCIREQDSGQNPLLMTTRLEQFHGTAWSRMRGFNGMTPEEVQFVVNGVISILQKKDARTANPIRLFEQGLISGNPYIRILLWVTAIDGILMAVKEGIFVNRLCALLGAASQVFPPEDGVHITRLITVSEVAGDLFKLRSELAHGSAIQKKYWEARDDLRPLLPLQTYSGPARYWTLLEEAALSLLTRILRKIILDNLVEDFFNVKQWRERLKFT